jgi:hypothetical protein
MTRDGTHRRCVHAITSLTAALVVLAAATSAGAARPASVSETEVLRGGEPLVQASAPNRKGGGKTKARATTRSSVVSISAGSTPAATAACTGKSHLTGGGFAVSPAFAPGASGPASSATASHPSDRKAWIASSSAFSIPPGSGTLTGFARCESNSLGKTTVRTLTGAVGRGDTTTAILDCPRRTHAVGGGYAGTPHAGGAVSQLRTFFLQSRRANTRQWAVTAFTPQFAALDTQFTGYVICERDGRGRRVTEESSISPVASDARTSGDASCGGSRHVVSGGFEITDADPVGAPVPFFDESHPVGKKTWHNGLWDSASVTLPAGTQMETFAYCKRIPRAKKPKR